jgi:hypothetical protein
MDEILEDLNSTELEEWKEVVRDWRARLCLDSDGYVDAAVEEFGEPLGQNMSVDDFILQCREKAYTLYLADESKMNSSLISWLGLNRPHAKELLTRAMEENLLTLESLDLETISQQEFEKRFAGAVGHYGGAIYPYLYALGSSNTNARRARSGQVFEKLIYRTLDSLGLSYDDQSTVGQREFEAVGLGKKVDAILPSTAAYGIKRDDCVILSMKTSLRERWQQLVEELQRTRVPHIYLATLGEDLNEDKLRVMKEHNITLVVPSALKDSKYHAIKNVLGFEAFFKKDLAYRMQPWGADW